MGTIVLADVTEFETVKISELPAASDIDSDDVLPVVRDGITSKITSANLHPDATNLVKGLATPAQITELEANSTHRISNGSDHSYIDQDVTNGSSPTFDGTNIDNIDADTLIADVKEANVSAVKKGQPCAIVGSSGAKFEVQLAACDNANIIRLLGIAEVNTDQNETGKVIHKGLLTNVNTQTSNTDLNPGAEVWAAGEMLYVSQTPGGLTKTRPTSGRCIKACRSLKGNSASDTLLAIVHTNPICACAASGEDLCSRMGDSAGVNTHSFRNYANAEKAAFDSLGNLTLSGTVDGRDIAADGAKLDKVGFTTPTELTISTGSITVSGDRQSRFHNVDTESDDATDDLETISGGNTGDILILQAADSTRSVVCKDGTNLKLQADFTLDNTEDKLMLICISAGVWHELTRASNGA